MTSADFSPSSRNRVTSQDNNGEWPKWIKRQVKGKKEEEEEEEENASGKPDYDRGRGITIGSDGLSLPREEECD
ncbi:hypothetical protein PUN28_019796 [Cardiocondyla obscurior]|uniref:Uncharacterized protein n=1 Tax=Cardiocondyla obscurior TaxID=286306 RepID=A0AAW2EBD7_9HYME